MFRIEKDLEDYLEAYLSLLEQDLLIIGRQVKRVRARIDLLAIDSAGVIYVIELKLHEAQCSIVTQALRYRRSIKRLNREEIIRLVADGSLKIDLVEAFQRRFGHPLPPTVNESPVVVIIAESVHPETADCILELLDEGYPITTFRYVRSDAVSLIPCCRNEEDVEQGSHTATRPRAARNRLVLKSERSPHCRVSVDETIRRFWSTQAQHFMPIVTFGYIYERYTAWAHEHEAEGVRLQQRGRFGQHLSAIVAESNEWNRVFVPRDDVTACKTSAAPLAARTYRAYKHVAAYQRPSVGNTSGL